ncbi:hypothetical protein WN51_05644 [Melipona quadrifasciata]|uniref:Uncharacterized protein n=1 Tax=Melipona quadrifasciata TaxID=166423 RepID=A0A0N0U3P7_9HYME|nr:hypothetical protein WN51_05644 [Melipona quadrifasciata]
MQTFERCDRSVPDNATPTLDPLGRPRMELQRRLCFPAHPALFKQEENREEEKQIQLMKI